jgi:3-phosphoshikimate 1-carboxyvinyltransferase
MESLPIRTLPKPITAKVSVPGSKSYTNRALIMAAMTPGKVTIKQQLICDDTEAMMSCLQELGVKISRKPGEIVISGGITDIKAGQYNLNANLSGITMRFLTALACVIPGAKTIGGAEGLNKRPIGDLVEALRNLGAKIDYIETKGFPPIRISSSKLTSHTVQMNGGVSSQYFSALMMIAPLAGGLTIEVLGEQISKPYIDMTIDTMKYFGVEVINDKYTSYVVAPGNSFKTSSYTVEGDISSASYFFAIAALTESTITVTGVNPQSKQADMEFLSILKNMGSKISYGDNSITVQGAGVNPANVDTQNCPDQAMTLAVLAAFTPGKTIISGVKSLRVKETERVKAVEQELAKMGVKTSSTPDSLTIYGGNPHAAAIDTYGDHRMAMAFAVAGTKLPGMVINNPEVVSKTFPEFWDKLASLYPKNLSQISSPGQKSSISGQNSSVFRHRTTGTAPQPVQNSNSKLGDFGVVERSGTGSKSNIILTGMRGSGKNTVGELLAKQLNKELLDIDATIVHKVSKTIPQIIEASGWQTFRDEESVVTAELSKKTNAVIATGGGTILRPENVVALKNNGIMVLLKAKPETLAARIEGDANRPSLTAHSNVLDELKQLWKERKNIYESTADITVLTDGRQPEEIEEEIIQKIKGKKS